MLESVEILAAEENIDELRKQYILVATNERVQTRKIIELEQKIQEYNTAKVQCFDTLRIQDAQILNLKLRIKLLKLKLRIANQ